MLIVENQIVNLTEIRSIASSFSKKIKVGDVIMLKGELGSGKTTFSRFLINDLYLSNNLTKPSSINSPTYPILLTYDLNTYEVFHYDFYRIKSFKELEELDFFSNINNSITLIEWPELLIDKINRIKYYLISLDLYSENERVINIKYFE